MVSVDTLVSGLRDERRSPERERGEREENHLSVDVTVSGQEGG